MWVVPGSTAELRAGDQFLHRHRMLEPDEIAGADDEQCRCVDRAHGVVAPTLERAFHG